MDALSTAESSAALNNQGRLSKLPEDKPGEPGRAEHEIGGKGSGERYWARLVVGMVGLSAWEDAEGLMMD